MAATTLCRFGGVNKLHLKHLSAQPGSTTLYALYSNPFLDYLGSLKESFQNSASVRKFFYPPRKKHFQQRHSNRAFQIRAVATLEESVKGTVGSTEKKTLIKVCGVTTPEDAAVAAKAGADFIGMIMWPGSKRYVTVEQAAQISAVAKDNGAEPIAVFVDESAADIIEACAAADISIAQLHGDIARGALGDLPPDLRVVYVLHAEGDGTIRTPLPHGSDTKNRTPRAKSSQNASTSLETGGAQAQSVESQEPGSQASGVGTVEWLLVDGVSAGSGETYDWTNLRLPQGFSRRGWLLAGGLDPTNVAAALGAANPNGVDVASGVAGLDKIKKDKNKVEAFIQAVRLSAESGLAQA